MKCWAKPAAIPLICLFGGFLAGGLRDPLSWTVVAAVLWLTALAFPLPWPQALDLKLWGLWLAWAGLSSLTGDQPLKSLFPFSRWLGVLVFFAMARSYWREEDRNRWLAGLWILGPFLGLCALLIQTHGYPMTGLLWPYYNYTTFALAATAAAALAMLGRPSSELNGWRRRLPWAAAALALCVILMARSRSGFWAICAAAAFWMLRRGKGRLLFCAVLALLALAALLPAGSVVRFLKLDTVGGWKRPQIWGAALKAAQDHPFLGEGPGNFEQGFIRHNFVSGFAARYGMSSDHAHSEPLEIAAETGWVGLALFLAALTASLRRLPRQPTLSQEAGFYALTAMAAQCLVDNMLHLPSLALLFFSALACAQKDRPPEQPTRGARAWRLACLGGLALSSTAWIPRRLVESCRARYERESDANGRLEAALRCARLFPSDYYHHEMLAYSWLGLRPSHFEQALEALRRAARLNPTSALYPKMQAEILRLRGRWQDVAALADKAVELEPDYQGARLLRAEAWARLGHPDWARQEMEGIDAQRARRAAAELYANYDTHILAFDQERYDSVRRLVRQAPKKKVE